jgi:hypothetical protein
MPRSPKANAAPSLIPMAAQPVAELPEGEE